MVYIKTRKLPRMLPAPRDVLIIKILLLVSYCMRQLPNVVISLKRWPCDSEGYSKSENLYILFSEDIL